MFAHTLQDQPESAWESLKEHLKLVAEGDGERLPGAAGFAAAFGAAELGMAAGYWHDLGKYAQAFQDYLKRSAAERAGDFHKDELRSAKGRVDHATAGAVHASRNVPLWGPLLAYCIAGHHGGLPNSTAAEGETQRAGLDFRLKHLRPETEDALESAPAVLLHRPAPAGPRLTPNKDDDRGKAFTVACFTRMLFSCLVDADFLATEQFMNPQQAASRPAPAAGLDAISQRLDRYLRQLAEDAGEKVQRATVNTQRQIVLAACRAAADQAPGLFSLTVPTGGGKTLSSLSFALRHALAHDLRRVIVAIPFTSIIEQNAEVYRAALGDLASHVLEHHSNLDPQHESLQNRLAAENWDAPLVVTTNVQLLESLFASKPSRCRKLHRIARSVIVLDEAQALPAHLLAPTLAVLRELLLNYGCSIVLCTATQPALERRPNFDIGLDNVRSIIPPAQRDVMFQALRRVQVTRAGVLDDAALVDRLANEKQVLCIVNTRKHAAKLFELLAARVGADDGPADATAGEASSDDVDDDQPADLCVGPCLHLSANMCPRHRSAMLEQIRKRLDADQPCLVVSTQLVEAGVDVDFPVVYRAMAGLDAIAQAAGRCNRNGELRYDAGAPRLGQVVVFQPDLSENPLPKFVKAAVNDAEQVWAEGVDPLADQTVQAFFDLHYWGQGPATFHWDRPPGARSADAGVLACFDSGGRKMQFREAAKRYRLIDDDQDAILIPWGQEGRRLVKQLTSSPKPPGRDLLRQLQRYVVTVPRRVADAMLDNRILLDPAETHGQLVLSNDKAYDREVGLRSEVVGMDPVGLIY